MRVGSFAVARPNYYDRNATSTLQNYSATVAPHADTTRWTTTVAAGKKLSVELIHIYQERRSAATSPSQVNIQVNITSGATTSLAVFTNDLAPTAIGARDYRLVTNVSTLYPAEVIYVTTTDASVGGTMLFLAVMKGTTYDA